MYCPSPFMIHAGTACIYNCMEEPGYRTQQGAQPRCVRTDDSSKGFDLIPVSQVARLRFGNIQGPILHLSALVTSPSGAPFVQERTRVRAEIAIVNGTVARADQLRSAFQRLQDAENARDQAPDAYQKARVDYYTLLNGPSWVTGETQRVARSEVDPVVQRYRNEYVSLTNQMTNQAKAYDTMVGIKDKVFRVKDDLTYSADLLVGQVDKVRAQIALERRAREAGELDPAWLVWTDFALNIAIVVSLLGAIYLIVRKLMQPAEDDDPEGELGDALTKLFQQARPPAFTEGAAKA